MRARPFDNAMVRTLQDAMIFMGDILAFSTEHSIYPFSQSAKE
jgi:hypothetical protein